MKHGETWWNIYASSDDIWLGGPLRLSIHLIWVKASVTWSGLVWESSQHDPQVGENMHKLNGNLTLQASALQYGNILLWKYFIPHSRNVVICDQFLSPNLVPLTLRRPEWWKAFAVAQLQQVDGWWIREVGMRITPPENQHTGSLSLENWWLEVGRWNFLIKWSLFRAHGNFRGGKWFGTRTMLYCCF